MEIESVPPHPGPPDAEGWWLVQVPTKAPYLMVYDESDPPNLEKLWQAGFKCWRLESLTENKKMPNLLGSLLSRPQVFWDLAKAFAKLQMAGPWVELSDGAWVRRSVHGKDIATIHWDDTQEGWSAYADGREFIVDVEKGEVEEAQEETDKRLTWNGYFLIDDA